MQNSLERNKLKSYRKPRNNEALLVGLLYCSCGSRMYPKLTNRTMPGGQPVYTYVCKMKERSKRNVCSSKNANGNILDAAIIDQIKALDDNKGSFMEQLEKSRRFYTGNRESYEESLSALRQDKVTVEKKMEGLIDSLAELGDSAARGAVAKRIEKLSMEILDIDQRLRELEGLTSQHALSDIEFDVMRQLLDMFKNGIDEMSIQQKRAAIRTLVRKVVWDGKKAHIVLFGVQDGDIEYPDISTIEDGSDNEDSDDELLCGDYMEYVEESCENPSDLSINAGYSAFKVPLCEGSK